MRKDIKEKLLIHPVALKISQHGDSALIVETEKILDTGCLATIVCVPVQPDIGKTKHVVGLALVGLCQFFYRICHNYNLPSFIKSS